MQVDEGSMLRTHIFVNAQLFEDVSEEEGSTTIGPQARVANEMQAAFFMSSQQINS